MRVLWFSLTPSNYAAQSRGYNGCGWISSLEREVAKRGDIDLAVAFLHPSSAGKEKIGGVTYYPMRRPQSLSAKVDRFFRISRQDRLELDLCKRVLDDFRPDVVQVFGTESSFGLLARETDVPVVIHLQGLMGPYMNAWVPPGFTMWNYASRGSANPLRVALGLRAIAFNRHAAERELEIMRCCNAFMGRTEWDRAFVSLHAPQARYYTCWEVLRSCFYEPGEWAPPANPVLVSTVSGPLYKGHDMILKTAQSLAESGLSGFEWRVYGVGDVRFAERMTGIRAADVGVRPMGVATANDLRETLLHASVYVHPSYVDNSPNSVCEAQALGVPIVATSVGGVPSLFARNRSCCLVPANDPLMAAARIRNALQRPAEFRSDREACLARHSPDSVVDALLAVYREMIGANSSPTKAGTLS